MDILNNKVLYSYELLVAVVSIILVGIYMKKTCVILTGICSLIFLLYFHRAPIRTGPGIKRLDFANDLVYSPANGKVLDIREDGKYLRIAIFLSVFDVHVQYAPMRGKLIGQQRVHGGYNPAFNIQASEKNEQLVSKFICTDQNSNMYRNEFYVMQMTGIIARRLVTFLKPGQEVYVGEQIGLIKFGSRVDVLIPKENIKVLIKKGQKVIGGQTPIIQL